MQANQASSGLFGEALSSPAVGSRRAWRLYASVLVSSAMLLASGPGSATAISNIQAVIDWDSFSLALPQGSTWNDQLNSASSTANSSVDSSDFNFDSQTVGPWSHSISTHFDVVDAHATADVDFHEVAGSARARAEKPTLEWGVASGDAAREGEFVIGAGGGAVTVSVNYVINLFQLSTTEICEAASVEAMALLDLRNLTLAQSPGPARHVLNAGVANGDSLPAATYSGTLTLTQAFNAGDTGYVYANAYARASANAPEPASWALIMLGLGLMGWRGRVRGRSST